MSAWCYRAYGLTFSSPIALPGLKRTVSATPDISFADWDTSAFASLQARCRTQGDPHSWFVYRELENRAMYLRWRGLFEFLITGDGRHVFYRRAPNASLESFSVYLLGQVLSFSLLAFGVEALHGTVVAQNEDAVALVGDCGFGKSTLAAALLTRGCRLVTDDLVVVDEQPVGWTVRPGVPRLKLYPSVAQAVLGDCGKGTPMNSATEKLVLPLTRSHSATRALALKAIYVLGDPGSSAARVHIRDLNGRDAFLEVVRGAFNLLVRHADRLRQQVEFARRLARSVPVRCLDYPRTLALLPAVCDSLLVDIAR